MRLGALLTIIFPSLLFAQSASTVVGVDLDTSVFRIGEQVQLRMRIDHDPAIRSIEWPAIGDTLGGHLEVVADRGVDTIPSDGTLQRQERTLLITSFDTGFWAVPPFRFVVDGKPMESKALLLEVRTVPLDSASTMQDIKDIITLPFSMGHWVREHKAWLLGGVAVLLILALLVYLFMKRPRPTTVTQEPTIPLYQRVLAALETLEKERLWQQGDHKGYHSRITDLLRGYIEERYHVPALESTTDELIRELRVSPLSTDQRGQLENMLRLADMVKFAKTTPSSEENERMMTSTVRFVSETRSTSELVGHG